MVSNQSSVIVISYQSSEATRTIATSPRPTWTARTWPMRMSMRRFTRLTNAFSKN